MGLLSSVKGQKITSKFSYRSHDTAPGPLFTHPRLAQQRRRRENPPPRSRVAQRLPERHHCQHLQLHLRTVRSDNVPPRSDTRLHILRPRMLPLPLVPMQIPTSDIRRYVGVHGFCRVYGVPCDDVTAPMVEGHFGGTMSYCCGERGE